MKGVLLYAANVRCFYWLMMAENRQAGNQNKDVVRRKAESKRCHVATREERRQQRLKEKQARREVTPQPCGNKGGSRSGLIYRRELDKNNRIGQTITINIKL